MKKKIMIFIYLIVLLMACENNTRKQKIISDTSQLSNFKKNILIDSLDNNFTENLFNYKTIITCDSCKLIIVTTMVNDCLKFNDYYRPQITLKQVLNFYIRDSLVKIIEHRSKDTIREVVSGRMYKMLQTQILRAGIIGKKNKVYYIEGLGSRKYSEYFALYSLKGDLLWYLNANELKTLTETTENNTIFYKIMQYCNVDTSFYRNELVKMITVSPYEHCKEVFYERMIIVK